MKDDTELSTEQLKERILELTSLYAKKEFAQKPFFAEQTAVPVSGKVFDHEELRHLVEASLDFWLTTGRFAAQFETRFARYFGLRSCLLVNSGSSANLLALSTLCSPKLGERQLKPGHEVITCAVGFPTTVNPVIQAGLVPVFVDAVLPSYNINTNLLEQALSSQTRAIMIAHTLGNPFELDSISAFAKKHNLWLIEDCCDAVGSEFNGQKVGTFGDLATVSFYPAHHITMGEGGALLTNSPQLAKIAESYRDWGRDCYCAPGKDNTCGKRFDWQLGQLPQGYDHKYIYSHVGYNLKLTDMQAAIGVAQLDKLNSFIETRIANFNLLYEQLLPLSQHLILPQAAANSNPSWFGFPISLRNDAKLTRNQLIQFLEARKIATRLMFAGNLIRQPAYRDVKYRVIAELPVADFVMNNTFWIGVYPGLNKEMLEFVVRSFFDAFK